MDDEMGMGDGFGDGLGMDGLEWKGENLGKEVR